MSKAGIHYNTSDIDDAPPPSYAEAQNSAYNPHYTGAAGATHASSDSGDTIPSAPPLLQEQNQQQQPPPSPSPNDLYPSLPAQQPQQIHYQHYQQQLQPQPQPYYQSGSQYQYQSINIPPPVSAASSHRNHFYRQREAIIRYRPSYEPAERSFPIGALLFLFGWICPFLWFAGACCCSGRRNPYEAWWGKVNTVMALLLIMSSIIYSMVAVSSGDWLVGLNLASFSTA